MPLLYITFLISTVSNLNSFVIKQGLFKATSITKVPGKKAGAANITFSTISLIHCGLQNFNYRSNAFAYNSDLQLCHVNQECFFGIEHPYTNDRGWQTLYRKAEKNEIILGIKESLQLSNIGFVINAFESKKLNFSVLGFADASVSLLSNDTPVFRVKIGQGGDSFDSILKIEHPKKFIKHPSRPALLSCAEHRSFWVKWSPTEVMFGTGSIVTGNPKLLLNGFYSTSIINDIMIKTYQAPIRWILNPQLE